MPISLLDFISTQMPLPLAAAFDDTRPLLLWSGLATLSFGVFLMFLHKRTFERIEQQQADSRTVLFEHRKFRRRTMLSSLIAAMGVILASLNWAIEPMVFTILVLLILILILAILGLATLDMLSISLRGLSQSENGARQAMIDEYLRQRKKNSSQNSETENQNETEA